MSAVLGGAAVVDPLRIVPGAGPVTTASTLATAAASVVEPRRSELEKPHATVQPLIPAAVLVPAHLESNGLIAVVGLGEALH